MFECQSVGKYFGKCLEVYFQHSLLRGGCSAAANALVKAAILKSSLESSHESSAGTKF